MGPEPAHSSWYYNSSSNTSISDQCIPLGKPTGAPKDPEWEPDLEDMSPIWHFFQKWNGGVPHQESKEKMES